ncbi:hypothetical protein BDZ89DRAFT_945874, partial [Hymenopellis radicata]
RTPAQQVLVSAADRWGLLGLLVSIKSAGHDSDDLGTMGLDMGFDGNLYSTFITPWSDQSAARSVEPDYVIPACYNVATPPPGPSKVTGFSDETLFFMFYSSPRDALQEVAAQELWNRNWRFHKTLRMWITKETGMVPSHKVPGGESGQYHVWDAELWAKERRDMTVRFTPFEEGKLMSVGHVCGIGGEECACVFTGPGLASCPGWSPAAAAAGAGAGGGCGMSGVCKRSRIERFLLGVTICTNAYFLRIGPNAVSASFF